MLKCPTCASSLRFDIASQKLHCDYCSNDFEPDIFDQVTHDAELQEDSVKEDPEGTGLYEAAVWICPSCGAVLTYADDTDVTSVCAYCGSRTIMFERIRGERRPDSIVPFTITKEECIRRYKSRSRKAFLSPGSLHGKGRVEGFRGIYMPYFDYYADLDGDLRLYSEKHNKSASSGSYDVYDLYRLEGHAKGKVLGLSHDASERFSDDISESLGEFGEKKPFTPGYLCGFYAETADAGPDTYRPSSAELEEKVRGAILSELKGPDSIVTSNADTLGTIDSNSIDFYPCETRSERTLYPVWFMSHRMRNGKLTYAAVNGSTGRVAADFPLSIIKVLLFALGAGLLFFLKMSLRGTALRPLPALTISMLMFLAGSFFNRFSLELKLKRLVPEYRSGVLTFFRVILIIFAIIITLVLLFNMDQSNTGWQVTATLACIFTLPERIVSMFTAFKRIRRINMETAQVTYRDLRFARAVIIINHVVTSLMLFVSLVVLLSDPLNEVYYYMSVANAVCFMGLFVFTIIIHNRFSYRRPPQFNKKGGDDYAE